MTLTPGSPEWCKVVTASKVAAILGHSPFMSQRAVWHLMRGEYQPSVTDAMERGHYLEGAVLDWWHDQHRDEFPEMMRNVSCPLVSDREVWAAATLDAIACPRVYLTEKESRADADRQVVVEAKTSSNDDEWGRPGTDEIPTHYLTQCYWSMHVSGIHEIRVPVLTSRLVFAEYVVHHDVEVGKLLEERCKAFYDSLWTDPPPPLDDSVATYECLRALNPEIDRGASVQLPDAVASEYMRCTLEQRYWGRKYREAKSAVLERMGTAQYATLGDQRVAGRKTQGKGIALYPIAKNLTLEGESA